LTAPVTSSATLVRKTLLSELSPPSPDSAGITYLSDVDQLLFVDSEVDEMPVYQGVNLWQISRTGSTVFSRSNTRAFSREPTGVAYDAAGKRLFVSDDDKDRVFQLLAGPDAAFGTADDVVSSFSTGEFGDDDAEDVAYDTATGELFVTQANAQRVWRVSPGPNGLFDGVAPTGDDVVSHFDVGVYGNLDIEGITYSAVRNSLFLADRRFPQIVEVSTSGALMQSIDVSGINMRQPAGITLAPASDDPSRTSMYVVARGRDNDTWPDENDGTMYELSAPDLGPVSLLPNDAPSVSAGPDRSVTLPTSAVLSGTATDDGRPDPPGQLTVSWSKVSGPGAVTFAHPKSPQTTAGFSKAGTYVLRLSASDSVLEVRDDVQVVVTGAGGQIQRRCRGAAAAVQVGPSTNDRLIGTGGIDLLLGMKGNDVLVGRGAGDCLGGGPGKDRIKGQAGNDDLDGNGGSDVLSGGGGADRLVPGTGRDKVSGGGGDDRVNAVDGKRDVVRCGGGVDRAVVDRHDKVAGSCERVQVRSPKG